MRHYLIYAIALILFAACSEEEVDENILVQDDMSLFEEYNEINSVITDLENLSEQTSQQVQAQNSSRSSNDGCFTFELLIPQNQEPIFGFAEYEYYNKMIIDQTTDACVFPNRSGKLEYYVAGVPNVKRKDSSVYKNVQYRDRHIYNGYRTSKLNEDLSNEEVQVFDVRISGTIENPQGDMHTYYSERRFKFRNRYTSSETISLDIESSLRNENKGYTINSVVGNPLIFKAECFNGLEFLRYPVLGSHDFSSTFGINFNIDYGDGTCDKKAILTPDDGDQTAIDL